MVTKTYADPSNDEDAGAVVSLRAATNRGNAHGKKIGPQTQANEN
jgi:hypothetical protein